VKPKYRRRNYIPVSCYFE